MRLTAVTSASLILYLGCMTAAARLEADDGAGGTVVWQVEGPSRITAMRNGVNEDTLPIGARISVEVHLNRDPSKYEVRGRRITKEDGSFLWLNGGPREQQEATAPGFSGMWEPKSSSTVARNFDYDNTNVGPTTWSLTPAGRDALERYQQSDMLKYVCLNSGQPLVWRAVRGLSVSEDSVSIYTVDGVRVVHMDRDSFDDLPYVFGGQSIGHWEGDVLVVETARFLYHPEGNAEHLASSSQKHVMERFELLPDGAGLTYSFVIEDPVYLAEPVELSMEWTYLPDLSIDDFSPCDEESFRRGFE